MMYTINPELSSKILKISLIGIGILCFVNTISMILLTIGIL